MKTDRKDCWSDGTPITAEFLIDWIAANQSICWPERYPLPAWFYSNVAEVIAPTVLDITARYHDDGRPYTEEENREAVARKTTLRLFRIWGRIRLGTLACRRCGGKILGADFVFDWKGSGPYNLWHSACFALQQIDPLPLYTPPSRKRTEAEQFRIDLDERKGMIQAERRRRRPAGDLGRRDAARIPPGYREDRW
ncbi:MAG: hypothetical protein GXY82_09205 [Methanospirillum sp.]|nr:hypothetical protein [Methanospirillum sp.]